MQLGWALPTHAGCVSGCSAEILLPPCLPCLQMLHHFVGYKKPSEAIPIGEKETSKPNQPKSKVIKSPPKPKG
ncbi:hypothetical protein Q9966_009436 [Columba livia]|nr:hypothetical protein Q9966_009436 [Columba livia]